MKKTILLIEDNDPIRENTAELLELSDFNVINGNEGQKALSILRNQLPDLILCDIMMPQMNGYEFLQIMKQEYQSISIPFIFFTAYSEKQDIEKGLQMGATDYLVKPFDGDDLINIIKKYLPEQTSEYNKADSSCY